MMVLSWTWTASADFPGKFHFTSLFCNFITYALFARVCCGSGADLLWGP
jgi:hypothetical protein